MRPVDNGRHRIGKTIFLMLLIAVASISMSGCIVWLDDVWCDDYPPRMATVHVYALDYYTGTPIPWAMAELYERDWWDWDRINRTSVDGSGQAVLYGGYLYRDECGGTDEQDFRVVVYADGYYSDYYQVELSYHHPWETLTFYMLPWYGRDAVPEKPNDEDALHSESEYVFPEGDAEPPRGRIEVGGEAASGEQPVEGEGVEQQGQ